MNSGRETNPVGLFGELNDFLQQMESVDTSDLGVDLLLGRKEDTEKASYSFGRITVDTNVASELESLVRDKVEDKYSAHEEKKILFDEYDIANRDRDKTFVQHVPFEEVVEPERFNRLFEGERFSRTTYTEGEKPEFQAIRLKDEDSERMAIAFIHYTRRQIMGRTSRLKMKMLGDETHRQVENSLLSIPDRVDAVYYDGMLYVFDQTKFEQIFDYIEKYKSSAEEVVESIREKDIPFEDFEMFEEAVYGNNRVLRLMHEVEQRGVYDEMNPDDVEHVRENYETDVKFKENEDGDLVITMENKRDIWAVLRFFNDDHLESPLTDEQYLSLSKQDAG
jgi:hypothetical protein